MNCIKCNVSMFDKPLSRTKPTGQPDGGWMCQDCMRKHEPDLYKCLKSDGDLDITNDIFNAINSPVDDFQRCPKCGAKEIEANTPRTVYACGSSDYDQRPGTFTQSFTCQDKLKKP